MHYLRTLLVWPLTLIMAMNLNLDDWHLKHNNVTVSLEGALRDYFSAKTRLLSVALHLEFSYKWRFIINDYLTEVLRDSKNVTFKLDADIGRRKGGREVFSHNLWYVDSFAAFELLLPNFNNYAVQELGQYMLIMEVPKHIVFDDEVQKIFQLAFHHNILNIVVAVYASRHIFNIYSYEIFQNGNCRKVQSHLVNRFYNGYFDKPELFPYKLSNFKNCPLTLHVRSAVPYFSYNLTKDGQRIAQYSGIEAQLIDTMAQRLNFDLQFYLKKVNLIGNVYGNGTATGPFQLLKENKIDLLLGYYNTLTRTRYFSSSKAYFFSPMVLIYRQHIKSSTFPKWIKKPFETKVWYFIFLILALGFICTFIKGFPANITWLDLLGMALSNARPMKIQRILIKSFLLMWCMSSMIFCASYQGKLYDAFNRQPPPKPSTLQNLIDSNYTFLLRNDLVEREMAKSLTVPPQAVQYYNFNRAADMYKVMQQFPGNIAAIASYWQYKLFVHNNPSYKDFDFVPEYVTLNQVCVYMRQHSLLNEPISRILSQLNAGGIIKKWMSDEAAKIVKNSANDKTNPQPIPLTLEKFRLLFITLMWMILLSIIVFLIEIVMKKV